MTSSASDSSVSGLLARFPALRRLAPPRRRIPIIQQLTATECGVACLAMVLCYFGRETTREEARDILGVGRGGTSARDLLGAARHYGLRGRGVRVELDALRFLPRGSILHWGFNHFVVLERATAKGVTVVDPAIGRRLVPAAEAGKNFTGVALVLEPGDDFAPARGGTGWKGRTLGGLAWRSGEWGRILATSALLLSLTAALPLFTGVVVDRVVPRADRHLLQVMLVGLGALVAFHLVASLVRAHLLLHLRTMIDVRMTLGLVEHLISLPYAFFQRRSAGDLLMRINSNAVIREVLTSGALSSVLDGLLIVLYTLLLFALDAVMGALVLAAGALQVGVFFATRRRRADVNAAVIAREARAQSYQVEMIGGIETLKAMGCEERAAERWADLFVDVQNASLARGRLGAAVDAVSGTLRLAAPLVILAVGAHAVLRGDLSLGAMLAINTFAIGVFTPLASLVATAVQLQTLDTYLDRVLDIRAAAPEQDRSRARAAGALRGRIQLEDVSFRYGPLDPLVVQGASLTIEPGQLVALVGRSGSGKSSLASLLFGLYTPTSGRVLYDGIPLSELDLRSVRKRLGVVTQRVYLFSGSVRANIALGDPDLPHEAVVRAAQRARIHDDIQALPMGYETLLVDGGGSLSGGQRQRIALARALAREPAILLLDEATSALDAITEREVQEELAALRCTRVVIAHRLSTILRADLILVMDGGRVVERGTHDELLARGGLYAELVSTQLDGGASA